MRDKINIITSSEVYGLQIKEIEGYYYILLTSSMMPTKYYYLCYNNPYFAEEVLKMFREYETMECFVDFDEVEKINRL